MAVQNLLNIFKCVFFSVENYVQIWKNTFVLKFWFFNWYKNKYCLLIIIIRWKEKYFVLNNPQRCRLFGRTQVCQELRLSKKTSLLPIERLVIFCWTINRRPSAYQLLTLPINIHSYLFITELTHQCIH